MKTKILNIIQWVLLLGMIAYLTIGYIESRKEPPLKEVFYINLEQFPDGTFCLQYAIDGHVESAGFYDWSRYLEYTDYLKTMYVVNEDLELFQHGIDNLDLKTGRVK